MKIYLLIKPQDYTFADVEVFTDLEDAENCLKENKRFGPSNGVKNTEYWVIREEEI